MFTNSLKKLQTYVVVATLLLTVPTALIYGAATGKLLPLKGQSGGSITTVGFNPVEGVVYTQYEGKGQATHLGKFSVTGNTNIQLFTGTVTGTSTFTAANGDMLFVTMTGTGIDPTHGSGVFTIVGGTGRYAGATGSYQQNITFAAPGGSADVIGYTEVFEGSIIMQQ